jgi:hypothetical protein
MFFLYSAVGALAMQKKKVAPEGVLALYSPPSHPASSGQVWKGETCPSPSLLAEALTARTLGEATGSDGSVPL